MMSLMLGLAMGVAAPGPKELPKKDPPSILGEWIPETTVRAGKPDSPPAGTTFSFIEAGSCFIKEGRDVEEIGYKLNANKVPAEIDMTHTVGEKSKTLKGIYKIEGDTLMICLAFDGDRPTKFVSLAGTQSKLITLKRVKKD